MQGGWEVSLSDETCLTVLKLCLYREAHCLHAILEERKYLCLDSEDVLSYCRAVDGALVCAHVHVRAWTWAFVLDGNAHVYVCRVHSRATISVPIWT